MEPEKKEKGGKDAWHEKAIWLAVSVVCFTAYTSFFAALIANAFNAGA